MNVEIFGINITAKTKREVLDELEHRITANQKTFIVTPYSEFFYHAFKDYEFKRVLNAADYALPDGIGVLWLAYYFSIPLTARGYYRKAFQAFGQMVYTGAQILFAPGKLHKIVPEKISGADFFWDLVRLAKERGLSIYLLGGFGNTSQIVANKILQRYPSVRIAGYSNKSPREITAAEINASHADILMVAFGPVRQEYWIRENLPNLNVKIAIGLGGTFDYVSGKKIAPPKWIRAAGLEWLYRLLTQPTRFIRIWQGTVGLITGAIRQKVFSSLPYRPNVIGVIINASGEVLIAKRKNGRDTSEDTSEEHWQFPQGGIEPQENPAKAVLREVFEETGLSSLEILGKADENNSYTWNHPLRNIFGNRLKFKGQNQIIYFLKYRGGDTVKVDDSEFDAFKWVPFDKLLETVHPVRKKSVEIILNELHKFYERQN